MRSLPIVLFLAVPAWFGCDVPDDERCPDGFDWNADAMACVEAASDGDTDSESDTDTGEPDGGGGSGLGEECEDDSDCADFEADYCVLNPLEQGPGYCSLTGCDTSDDDCPDSYTCCDCTGLGLGDDTTCLTDEDAVTVANYGCVCAD